MGTCGMGIPSEKGKDALKKAIRDNAIKKRQKELKDKKLIKKEE